MRGMFRQRHFRFIGVLTFFTGLVLVGCGVQAVPRPTFEPTATFDFSQRFQPTREIRPVSEQTEGESASGENEVARAVTNTPEPTLEPPPPTIAPTETLIPTDPPTPTDEPLASIGDPVLGQQYFNLDWPGGNPQSCKTCHNVNEPLVGIGPYLYGIANAAASRREGYTAEEYLYESIANPTAFVAPLQGEIAQWPVGDVVNAMPLNWLTLLGEQGVNDIVAYLLTLSQPLPE